MTDPPCVEWCRFRTNRYNAITRERRHTVTDQWSEIHKDSGLAEVTQPLLHGDVLTHHNLLVDIARHHLVETDIFNTTRLHIRLVQDLIGHRITPRSDNVNAISDYPTPTTKINPTFL